MNQNFTPPNALLGFSRLFGWSLLLGGLVLSLLADSLTGIGSLAGNLEDLGFPAGTICVAGFLLLALSPSRGRERGESTSSTRSIQPEAIEEASSTPERSELKRLEERLIAELDRRHEGLREDLHELAALLDANMQRENLGHLELPLAAGAELSAPQLRPTLRRLGPKREPRTFEQDEDEELDIFVELEESAPDETRLWSQDGEYLETGDLEDRLTGDVIVDDPKFDWSLPGARKRESEIVERSDEEPAPTEPTQRSDEEPQLDRENIQWFDWDEDDLV